MHLDMVLTSIKLASHNKAILKTTRDTVMIFHYCDILGLRKLIEPTNNFMALDQWFQTEGSSAPKVSDIFMDFDNYVVKTMFF